MSHNEYKENKNTNDDIESDEIEPIFISYTPLKIVLAVIFGLAIDIFFLSPINSAEYVPLAFHITIGLCALILYKEIKRLKRQ